MLNIPLRTYTPFQRSPYRTMHNNTNKKKWILLYIMHHAVRVTCVAPGYVYPHLSYICIV